MNLTRNTSVTASCLDGLKWLHRHVSAAHSQQRSIMTVVDNFRHECLVSHAEKLLKGGEVLGVMEGGGGRACVCRYVFRQITAASLFRKVRKKV